MQKHNTRVWRERNPHVVRGYERDRLVRCREKINAQQRARHEVRVLTDSEYAERKRAAARKSARKRRADPEKAKRMREALVRFHQKRKAREKGVAESD